MKQDIKSGVFVFIFLALGLLACDTSSNVASPAKNYFVKFFGDEGYQTGVDAVVNSDGTFILLGNSATSATDLQPKLYLVKADVFGNTIWKKTFGGTNGTQARDVEVTSDGGIVVLANYFTSPTDRDILVMRFNQDGSKRDSAIIVPLNQFNDANIHDDDAQSITELSDGGFIIAGSSSGITPVTGTPHLNDGIHLRLNSALVQYGVDKWKPVQGAGSVTVSTKIFQAGAGVFFDFGYTNGALIVGTTGDFNFYSQVLTSTGETSSTSQTLLGQPDSDERLGAVGKIAIGGQNTFFLGGISTSKDNSSSGLYVVGASQIVKATKDTAVVSFFQTKIGVALNTPGQSQASVAPSVSGGFFILTNEATTSNSNLFLTKIDNQGNLAWKSPVFFGGVGNDFSGNVTELPDGKLIITGTLSQNGNTKMVLIKVNASGQFAD